MAQDLYEVLGVPRTADADTLKAAFRKRAAESHPDRNPGNEDAATRFKAVNHAYQVLSDENRRAAYDRFGERAEAPGSPFGAGGPFAGGFVDLADLQIDGLFGDILGAFGVGRGDRGDLRVTMRVSFEEAAFGVSDKELTYERVLDCKPCGASGAEPGSASDTCPVCSGKGKIRFQQGIFPVAVERECTKCRGRGKLVRTPCRTCRGLGLAKQSHTLKVSLPPGIEGGETKRVAGAGNAPRPGKPIGDLDVVIEVEPHPIFRRDGRDVVSTVRLGLPELALGTEVTVNVLGGEGKLRVPAGTQVGSVLRIRGRGIPSANGDRGDHRVQVMAAVPTSLNDEQRRLLEELARSFGTVVTPVEPGLFDKLKNLFG